MSRWLGWPTTPPPSSNCSRNTPPTPPSWTSAYPPEFQDEGLRAAAEIRRRVPDFPVLVLSAYVEHRYADELLGGGGRGVGYLLKDRVGDVAQFTDALTRVAEGGLALDPDVVAQLLHGRAQDAPLASLTPREHEVLRLMAEGHDNERIRTLLDLSTPAVGKYIGAIFHKLGLSQEGNGHRRVQAVLTYLRGGVPDSAR